MCLNSIKKAGTALLFENPKGFQVPLLANLFETPERTRFT